MAVKISPCFCLITKALTYLSLKLTNNVFMLLVKFSLKITIHIYVIRGIVRTMK